MSAFNIYFIYLNRLFIKWSILSKSKFVFCIPWSSLLKIWNICTIFPNVSFWHIAMGNLMKNIFFLFLIFSFYKKIKIRQRLTFSLWIYCKKILTFCSKENFFNFADFSLARLQQQVLFFYGKRKTLERGRLNNWTWQLAIF